MDFLAGARPSSPLICAQRDGLAPVDGRRRRGADPFQPPIPPVIPGIRGKDFVMVCSDTSAVQSIVTMKTDEDKVVPVDSHKLFAISGEAGDRVNFCDYIVANARLYALRNGQALSTKAVANYTRGELAKALRQSPYNTNLLMAGFDAGVGPSLFWCDYLATLHAMNVCGTGYGSYFVLSMFDREWRPEMTEAEALDLMRRGVEEVKKRLVVAPPRYVIKVVDAQGIRTLAEA
jgi:20S proteasome subunit beta 4